MKHHRQRLLKRIEIRARLQAGEPVQQVMRAYLFIRPRKLALRAS